MKYLNTREIIMPKKGKKVPKIRSLDEVKYLLIDLP